MPSAGFKPTSSARERQQTYARDRAATAIGYILTLGNKINLHIAMPTSAYG